jgi:hypothetical protein
VIDGHSTLRKALFEKNTTEGANRPISIEKLLVEVPSLPPGGALSQA